MNGMGGFWDTLTRVFQTGAQILTKSGPVYSPAPTTYPSPVYTTTSGGVKASSTGIDTSTLMLLGAGAILLFAINKRR